jgi:radical SAM superfamily enzyme YgiQ (UPF0313 family)
LLASWRAEDRARRASSEILWVALAQRGTIRPHQHREGFLSEIVLTTLNARFIHSSFGLRYLHANLGALAERAQIVEFVVSERPLDIVERLVAENAAIVGFGVYIWNVTQTEEVVRILKVASPDTIVVLGGPEVSFGGHRAGIEALADHVVQGEADVAFRRLCEQLLAGEQPAKTIAAAPPLFTDLQLPYALYSDADIKNRLIYVEASRGCPFKCQFCLSSLDIAVRKPDLQHFLDAMAVLLDRGVRHFKFVDRTFNLNLKVSAAILRFFLDRYTPGLFLHFEMIPDRLPAGLRETIAAFPAGSLQFEVGVQTLNPEVGARIERRQDVGKLAANLAFLRADTGVHVHADLIVGLPGEDLESFARGFNTLVEMRPQEIQVGTLKRLKGTPIGQHDDTFGMRYSPAPPYEILRTAHLSFAQLQQLRRFARLWGLVANSGNFTATLPTLWQDTTPFEGFNALCLFAYDRLTKIHAISLGRLAQTLFDFRCDVLDAPRAEAAATILADFRHAGRTEVPRFVRDELPHEFVGKRRSPSEREPPNKRGSDQIPPRQARHLGTG